jgi:hypothetical protein
MRSAIRTNRFVAGIIAALLCLPVGTAFHELVGHGLTGVLAGGRIVSADVLFFQVWPRLSLHGWQGYYGQCDVQGIPTATGENIMALGGSMSTLIASIAALIVLGFRRWGAWSQAALLAVGVWWIDILTYTLPTWGIRRSIFWGGRVAEPYNAAVALGMSGKLFQAGVLIICPLLAAWWLHSYKASKRQPQKNDR